MAILRCAIPKQVGSLMFLDETLFAGVVGKSELWLGQRQSLGNCIVSCILNVVKCYIRKSFRLKPNNLRGFTGVVGSPINKF